MQITIPNYDIVKTKEMTTKNPVWEFLKKSEQDKRLAICKSCSTTHSLGSDEPKKQTVTGLVKHLERVHPDFYKNYLKKKEETTASNQASPSVAGTPGQPTLE